MGKFRFFSQIFLIATLLASISFVLNGSANRALGVALYPLVFAKSNILPERMQLTGSVSGSVKLTGHDSERVQPSGIVPGGVKPSSHPIVFKQPC